MPEPEPEPEPVPDPGWLVVLAFLLAPSLARADSLDDPPPDPPARRWHGSIAAGGSLLLTGDGGDSSRFDGSISFQPWDKLGVLAAARAIDEDPRSVMLTAGVEYQAAASRPRLALTLYGDVGIETAGKDPVFGVGVRTTFVIIGPLGVVGDTGFHLVIDGTDDTTLVIGSALMIALVR